MKLIIKKCGKKTAFTIIELLTVMSIIIILISLLVPALNKVKRYAREVRQKAQFHSIEVAMELFNTEFDGYPDSGAKDEDNEFYCGAMKLCEAMVGQDLMGFHPLSHFRSDGTDGSGTDLYPDPAIPDNLKARKGPYLQLENANAYRLDDLYADTVSFDGDKFVLCDVYPRVKNINTAKMVGMPILYYRANTSNTKHDPNNLPTSGDDEDQIYNYLDNDELVKLALPGVSHPLETEPKRFYESTRNTKITTTSRPYREDSYILLSAGFDGEYGTPDDIFNFEK